MQNNNSHIYKLVTMNRDRDCYCCRNKKLQGRTRRVRANRYLDMIDGNDDIDHINDTEGEFCMDNVPNVSIEGSNIKAINDIFEEFFERIETDRMTPGTLVFNPYAYANGLLTELKSRITSSIGSN